MPAFSHLEPENGPGLGVSGWKLDIMYQTHSLESQTMNTPNDPVDLVRDKLNLETSQIAWKELQRFFASGTAIAVSTQLDLVEVAHAFSSDETSKVEQWMSENRLDKVSDQLAQQWIATDATVWAVVIKPWILVQSKND